MNCSVLSEYEVFFTTFCFMHVTMVIKSQLFKEFSLFFHTFFVVFPMILPVPNLIIRTYMSAGIVKETTFFCCFPHDNTGVGSHNTHIYQCRNY